MKKYLVYFILLVLIIFMGASSRKFPDFPANDAPHQNDLVLIWDDGTATNQKLALGDFLYDDQVHDSHINPDVAGDGLGQDGSGALEVNVDGVTITISGDQLVANAGDISGQAPYYLTSTDDEDTIIIDITATQGSLSSERQFSIYTIENGDFTLICTMTDDLVRYYQDGYVLYIDDYGIRVDDYVYIGDTDVGLTSDGTTLSFFDVETGSTYSLIDLISSSLDLSGETNYGVLHNVSGALNTTANFTYNPSTYNLYVGNGGTTSGTYNFNFGNGNTVSKNYASSIGFNNVSSGFYSITIGGSNTASGTYSSAIGAGNSSLGYYTHAVGVHTVAHDYGETSVGHFGTTATGSATTISGGNRIFSIANGGGIGSESEALEVYQNGLVYALDSIRSPLIKTDSMKVDVELLVRDTTIKDLIIKHAPCVDTSSAFTATELLVATGSTTAESEDSATWSDGVLNITGDVDISDTLSIATVDINGGNTNPTGTTRLNIEGTIVPYNIWVYSANPILGNGIIQGTYSGATTTYSGIRGVANGGGIGVIAETQTFVGGTPLYVKSAILGDSKHSIFINGSDSLMVIDSAEIRIKKNLNVMDSVIFYPDSVVFTIPIIVDSIKSKGIWADFGLAKDYNYGNYWEDLQFALQNECLLTLKNKPETLQEVIKGLMLAHERLMRQMADELIKRDNEIIRLERKIDTIQLLRNEKLIFIFIGLILIWLITFTLWKAIK